MLIHDYSSPRGGKDYKALVMCTSCFGIFEVNRQNIIRGLSKQCRYCSSVQAAKKRPVSHLILPQDSKFDLIEEYSSFKICHTSRGCDQKTWKSKVRCKTCGDVIEVRRSSLQTGRTLECNSCSRKGEKHHSAKDKEEFGEAISRGMRLHPERHRNWHGGINELSKQIRRTREYAQWVEAVYVRDSYTCQFTGEKSKRLAAHHKKPLKAIIHDLDIKTLEGALNCPEIWDISNGITMSAAYHMKFHLYLDGGSK